MTDPDVITHGPPVRKAADERALFKSLRITLTDARDAAGSDLTEASRSALIHCIEVLSLRESALAEALPAASAPSAAAVAMPERRQRQRSNMSHVPLLSDVDPEILETVLAGCRFQNLAPDEVLLSPRQINRDVYIVMSGSVRVMLDDLEGPAHVELTVGEIIGELSILGQTKVTAHVLGSTPARLMVIDQTSLWLMIDHSRQFARKLLYTLSHRVGTDNRVLRSTLRKQRESERHANRDALTSIANRRGLMAYFETMVPAAASLDQPLSLLMVDVDHFKRLNDTYGHDAGDRVLVAIADLLSSHSGNGLAARYGGEEFTLVLPGADLLLACQQANELREKVSQLQLSSADGASIPPITISVGVRQLRAGDSLQSMIRDADSALYNAKRAGRNRVCAFDGQGADADLAPDAPARSGRRHRPAPSD